MQTKDFSYRVLSPILPLQLSIEKPKDNRKYPKEIITVGDKFKQLRLDIKLTQIEVAKQLSVNKNFVTELENNKRKLTIFALHKACAFLGYIPKTLNFDESKLQGKLFAYRIKNGLTYSNLSKEIGLDKSTLSRFEKGDNLNSESLLKITNYLKNVTHS